MRECLEQHKVAIMMMMVYYSNLHLGKWASRSMKELDLEMFRNMVKDFNLIDPQAPTCRSLNELDSVFVVRACACSAAVFSKKEETCRIVAWDGGFVGVLSCRC